MSVPASTIMQNLSCSQFVGLNFREALASHRAYQTADSQNKISSACTRTFLVSIDCHANALGHKRWRHF